MIRKSPYSATTKWPFHVSAGGVVFNRKGEVLLLRRYTEPGGGSGGYHLPKGTLELDESLEDCAKREISEESGYGTNIISYIGSLQNEFLHPKSKVRINKVTHFFYCKTDETQFGEHDDEHDEVIWVKPEQAIKLLKTMPKSEYQAVQRALAYRSLFSR